MTERKVMVKVGDREYLTVVGSDRDPRQHFVGNRVVQLLMETSKLNFNDLAAMYQRGMFTQEEYAEFYILYGYTLSGFMELSMFADMPIDNPLDND